MNAPRFSIVIPTRERPHTLEYTLATCRAQQTDDLEIVVSDNFSLPRTRELVEGCGDPRVRYVRTPALLAMTDSLEFALSQARGEYVLMQGDDDGLLHHAIPVIDEILRATQTRVLTWDCLLYNWPHVSNPAFPANHLLVPLLQGRTGHELRVFDSRQTIQAAANGHVSYSDLPVNISSVVHRDLLTRLRSKSGRVFRTCTPDVYGAFAVASQVTHYHRLRAPLSIAGRSGDSIGAARHYARHGSPIDREFRRQNAEAGYELHPWAPDLPPIVAAIGDAFLWARQFLFPHDDTLVLDRAQFMRRCLRECEVDTAEEWREIQSICRKALADSPELTAWFEREYGALAHTALPRMERAHHWKHYGAGHLFLDAAAFGVRDIFGVAELCEKLLGYAREGLTYRLAEGETGESLSELQEKEEVIQRLHAHGQSLEARLSRMRNSGWRGMLRRVARRFRAA
jgi:hypothetical protein